MLAQTNAIVSSTFLKVVPHAQWRRAAQAHSPFLFGNFFAFDFAKQMTDVSQARKNAALVPKKKWIIG